MPAYDERVSSIRAGLRSARDIVWRPSGAAMRGIALGAVLSNVGIMVSGAVVRVSESGLGCPKWPDCTGDSLVPAHNALHGTAHMAVEFGNRMVTFVVLAFAAAAVIAAWRLPHGPDRTRRRDLLRLAWLQPAGVLAQAGWGAVVIYSELNPAAVAAHFLLSAAVLAAAVVLWTRTGEGDAPPRPLVRAELRWLGRGLVAVVALLLLAGTVVTGTGPLAGDPSSPRFGFNIQQVAQLHADLVWITVGLTFALLLALRLTQGPRGALRWTAALLCLEAAQGVIGYTQYFLGVPPILVVFHVLGAALVWATTVRILLTLRERVPDTADHPAAAHSAADLATT